MQQTKKGLSELSQHVLLPSSYCMQSNFGQNEGDSLGNKLNIIYAFRFSGIYGSSSFFFFTFSPPSNLLCPFLISLSAWRSCDVYFLNGKVVSRSYFYRFYCKLSKWRYLQNHSCLSLSLFLFLRLSNFLSPLSLFFWSLLHSPTSGKWMHRLSAIILFFGSVVKQKETRRVQPRKD